MDDTNDPNAVDRFEQPDGFEEVEMNESEHEQDANGEREHDERGEQEREDEYEQEHEHAPEYARGDGEIGSLNESRGSTNAEADATLTDISDASAMSQFNVADQSPITIERFEGDGPSSVWRRAAGWRRDISDQNDLDDWTLDALAGRASVFGFGCEQIITTIQHAASEYLGDGSAFGNADQIEPQEFSSQGDGNAAGSRELIDAFAACEDTMADAFQSAIACPTSEHAVELAIALARRSRAGEAYRSIALVGGDHGRTGLCRAASGLPELHEGFGPMMAGFSHVPSGDLDALRAVMDDQTACVILSPIDFSDAAKPCSADFLRGARQCCNEYGAMLILDETQIVFGASGMPLTYQSIDGVDPDLVLVASGLFAGLSGGIVLTRSPVTDPIAQDIPDQPLAVAVARATLHRMAGESTLAEVQQQANPFAVAVAESIGGFDFVTDVNATGLTLGIETDLPSGEIVRTARSMGMRVQASGPTSIRLQPPLIMSESDFHAIVNGLKAVFQAAERSASAV